MLLSFAALSQSRATDFNLNDCDAVPHHLFQKVDQGHVVIMVWVMPCGPCAPPSKLAYNTFLSLDSLYSGRLLYYLIDDFGNTNCATLKQWGLDNIGNRISAFFSNSQINMSDYGTAGMPKIVVVGGPDYKIYYNLNASSTSTLEGFREAVLDAIALTSLENDQEKAAQPTRILHNSNGSELIITGKLERGKQMQALIYNSRGQIILQETVVVDDNGRIIIPLYAAHFTEGVYLLRLNDKVFKFIR